MFKFIAIVAVLGGVILFTPIGNGLKARVMSYVNPTASERSTLADLKQNLDKMSQTISQPAFQSLSNSEKTAALKSMISAASNTLSQAQDTADKTDLAATVSSAVSHIIPASWASSLCSNK